VTGAADVTGTPDARASAVLAESNSWAACARAHGWPDIADADPAAGALAEIEIPASITEDELRRLLADCPPFDAAAYAAAQAAWAAGDTAYPAPEFPYLTIGPASAATGGEAARTELLDLINQLQSEAFAAGTT
jgi:hypothetical protein